MAHLAFVVFVVIGGVAAIWWRWVVLLHVPAVFWGALVEIAGWVCPLTPLENRFREAGGMAAYSEGFIEHQIYGLVYPVGLTRETQIILGVAAIAVNILVYGVVWRRWRRQSAPSENEVRTTARDQRNGE